jgi:tetratricopeptide (TPR) repeat protein
LLAINIGTAYASFARITIFREKLVQDFYGIRRYGRTHVTSRFGRCEACRRYAQLNSYDTARFFQLFHIPLFSIGHAHIIDECERCGFSTVIARRKYKKRRAREFATMMQNLKEMPEYPDHVINGMQTLMSYNEELWFTGMVNQYRRLFENHVRFQLVVAEGLCRFGDYAKSEEACLKAIELEAGKRAEELLENGRMLHEAALKSNHTAAFESDRIHMILPYFATPAIITFVATLFVIQSILAARVREVWIVNGSQLPYSIQINKNRHDLKRYETLRLRLKFGEQAISLSGTNFPIHQRAFSYPVPAYSELDRNSTLVLNPDTMALLVQETLSLDGQTKQNYLLGQSNYTLPNIDFPFSDFPSAGLLRKKVDRGTRLYHHVPDDYLNMVSLLSAQNQTNLLAHFARTALSLQPDLPETPFLLPHALSDLDPAASTNFLQTGLQQNPPLIFWHRFYQDFMQQNIPHHDLQTEYALHCKAQPENQLFYYLLGRVVQDRNNAMLLFEKAEGSPHINGLGFYEIARIHLFSGNFKEALSFAEKAVDKAPSNPDFNGLLNEALLANGAYDRLLLKVQELRKLAAHDFTLAAQEMTYLTLLGRHDEAAHAGASFASENETFTTDENAIRWSHYLDAIRYYTVGNMKDYLKALTNARAPEAPYQQALISGHLDQALELLNKKSETTYTDYLLLFCAAFNTGQETLANEARLLALTQMPKNTPDQKTAFELLKGSRPLSIHQLTILELPAPEKALIAVALGYTHPAKQKICFNLARKYNYTPAPPHQLLKRWIQ